MASGRPIKRFGSEFSSNPNYEARNADPQGEDHVRFTTPGIVHASEWTGSGGRPVSRPQYLTRNPYTRMYDCRDVFYMGSVRSGGNNGVVRHKTDFRSYQQRQYRGCPTGTNQW